MVHYSFIDIIRNAFSLVYTKIAFPKARLIRWPLYSSGSGMKYGKGLTMGRGCRIDTNNKTKSLVIGENARIGDYVHINADYRVEIGDNVLMASKIFISDTNHGNYNGDCQSPPDTNPSEREYFFKEVIIGNNVWIGENVVVLPGTVIGDGCIIGANAVLGGKTYPSYSIIAGVPAKIIKRYNQDSNMWERI
jgi:acetyltransferase-like isoleucine patch superfamily enzyme